MMSHPFLSFRDNINSLFDDFHNDFFASDPLMMMGGPENSLPHQQQRRPRGGHGNHYHKRINWEGEPSTRTNIQQDSIWDNHLQPHQLNPSSMVTNWDQPLQAAANTIRLNIQEEKDKYTVEADVPGVKKEDVHLNIQDGYLTISAERKEMHQQGDMGSATVGMKGAAVGHMPQKSGVNTTAMTDHQQQQPKSRWLRREFHYGSAERRLALPRDIDQTKISAKHEDGVLKVTLPRVEKHQQQGKITIQ